MFGYDYPCETNTGCSDKWFSLDGTTDITMVAAKFNAILGKGWTPVKGNQVLILSSGQMKTVGFSSAHVNSVVCETIDE